MKMFDPKPAYQHESIWRMARRALVILLVMLNSPIPAADTDTAPFTPSTLALIDNARTVAANWELQVANRADLTKLEGYDERGARDAVERVLGGHTLFRVNINPEMRVKVNQGSAAARLVPGE